MLDSHLIAKTAPVALKENVISGDGYRITLLGSRLFRVERNKKNIFKDSATQMVWFRNMGVIPHTKTREKGVLKIKTEKCTLVFDEKKRKAVSIIFADGKEVKANNKGNFKGTARTLDCSTGYFQMLFPAWLKRPWVLHLEYSDGVVGNRGIAVIPDNSLLLTEEGTLAKYQGGGRDEYIFAYGSDYRSAIRGLYRISGDTPLLPRYALGNWWSRYKAYTQKEYTNLMQRFLDEKLPITVATIDMDWHWVDLSRFGKVPMGWTSFTGAGWTGYSWNTDLFPDYKGFLKWLRDNNFQITVNLHPASGVRCFEDMYEDMAREMGVDPASRQPVKFDITDPKFINAYFKYLHKPYEKEGVSFWWMDWQQGSDPKTWGLDPLWSLNHYHVLDNKKTAEGEAQRGMLLSRYAGVGSHRYPLGFSGDATMHWASLRYQPYFTVKATDIGYTWWSHDIGGHMLGVNDFELYLRWLQFGVFSPINRLHSSCNELCGKEPWKRRKDVEICAGDLLRLRHRLIPYIYTFNCKTHYEGKALCEPMYYPYPDRREAYMKKVRNQYMFGSEMMVCPIVSKTHKNSGLATVLAWLPEGRWTDFFTGFVYEGKNNFKTLARELYDIPVLVKEGGIIPLSADGFSNNSDNPKDMEIAIYRGNGSFDLIEDDGKIEELLKQAVTTFEVKEEGDKLNFVISKVKGASEVVPQKRSFKLSFKDVVGGKVCVRVDGEETDYEKVSGATLSILLKDIAPSQQVEVEIGEVEVLKNVDFKERAVDLCSRLQGGNNRHAFMFRKINKAKTVDEYVKAVKKSTFPKHMKEALVELL